MIWTRVFGVLLLTLPAFGLEICRLDYGSFGAVPDDGQDDSHAVQKALDYLVAQGGGTLQVPSGEFEIHSRVSVEGSFGFLRIEGAGQSLSRFVCLNDDGLLRIVSKNKDSVLEIVDLDLPPGRKNCGTALELVKPYSAPDDIDQNLLLSNLELKPVDLNTCHYAHVFNLDGWKALVDNINSSGFYGPKFNTFEGKRRKYEAKSIIAMRNAYQPRIQHCSFWAAEYGIVIDLTDAHREPTVTAAVSVETAHGIQITKIGDLPLSHPVRIDGCHWNNSFSGLVMKDVDSFRLVQNCLYGAWDIEDDYKDIKLVHCSNGELVDNSFWFGVKPRPNVYIGKDCHDIFVRNSHFGSGVSFEPVVIEKGARDIVVENNSYGTVYAMDEGDTFGLWEMEEMADGQALDKDRLHPGRNNDLVLFRAVAVPGSVPLKLGQALSFRDPDSKASSVQKWDGAPGVRIQFHVQIPDGFLRGESTILEVPGVYRLYLRGGNLCFSFDGKLVGTVLKVPNVAIRQTWLPILAEVDPVLGRAVLEVGGMGGDRRFLGKAELAKKKGALQVAPKDGSRKFNGAIDQLWIQSIGK